LLRQGKSNADANDFGNLGRLSGKAWWLVAVAFVWVFAPAITAPAGEGLHDTGAWPVAPSGNEMVTLTLPGGVALEMVRIPAGSFTMGSKRSSDQSPPRSVFIDYDFFLGKYPITQEQWLAVMGGNPSQERGGIGPRRPVQGVSWNDAQAFVGALNGLDIGTFRLPSEAEWEYACRAGGTTAYYFGDDPEALGDYAWYRENSGGQSQVVGQKLPNAFGLYDMHGNVWEWVQDSFHLDYHGAPTDGSAWEDSLPGGHRMLRGGAYLNAAVPCRSAYRNTDGPGSDQCFFGLRVVAVPQPHEVVSPDPYAFETSEERDERMRWWREARFGLFIHWGVYAVPAGIHKGERIPRLGEWIMWQAEIPIDEYREYGKEFNPVKYDPEAWVTLAKDAGMRYIVITAKHHDGFALFETASSGWNVVEATPYGKDLLKPLAEACRKHGIKLGFYYSEGNDWYHPGGVVRRKQLWDNGQAGDFDQYLDTVAAPQVRELLTNYGELAVLWWDGPGYVMNRERAGKLMGLLKLQPGIITNNRLGGGFRGDTDSPEQRIPATGIPGRDWETCMTMNDTWGYKSYDDNWKSPKAMVRMLIDIASKGGNYLLNVGPTADGEIPRPSVERLREIGRWMSSYSESIHATTASHFPHLPWGRSTTRLHEEGATLYLHLFDWPVDGELPLPGLRNEVTHVKLLGSGHAVAATRTKTGWTLALPESAPDPIASVIAVEIQGVPEVETVSKETAGVSGQ
jgi:alpha-L-fucosidase